MGQTEHEADLSGVTLLGNQNTRYLFEYDPTILEKFKRHYEPIQDEEQLISLDCFEFASRCKKTGQPDYGTIYISYIPGPSGELVESKSMKLYLYSYQQHQDFHETCIHTILNDLVNLIHPAYCEVYGDFHSRGGVSILPFSVYADEKHQDMKRARQLAMMQHTVSHTPLPRF